ncbi:MAG: cache domain-containing protein [Gammaproteobacteria bacterium]
MRIKKIFGEILLLSGVLMFPYPGFSGTPEPRSEEAKQIVSLVERAATLIETRGKDAFPEFRITDGEWYKGATYIFVIDMKGTSIVNPPSPELEGTNVLDTKDANGKALIREMIEMLESKESGWIDYMWPRPGQTVPSKKSSYIKKVKPGEETLIVGAGIYSD